MNDPTCHRAPAYVPEKPMGSNMPFKPISDEICAACGKPIDVQPGETFTASTDGKVWHYGCSPSRSRLSPLAEAIEQEISAWAFAHDIDGAVRNELFTRLRAAIEATRPTDEAVERVARAICWADNESGTDCCSKCMNAGKCMADTISLCFIRDARAAIAAMKDAASD